jgi:hypothetical protein
VLRTKLGHLLEALLELRQKQHVLLNVKPKKIKLQRQCEHLQKQPVSLQRQHVEYKNNKRHRLPRQQKRRAN